jgi:hypothetical protein
MDSARRVGLPCSVIAYFDANPVDHCLRLEAGVTAEMVQKLQRAVADGSLVIPVSMVTTEELLSTTLRDEQYAYEVGRFYLRLVSFDRTLKQPRDLTGEAIRAYATRTPEPSAFMPLSPRVRKRWEEFAAGNERPDEVRHVVDEIQIEIEAFYKFMKKDWKERQEEMKALRKQARRQGLRVARLPEVFDRHAREYAEAFARRYDHLRACKKRGIPGLLGQRRVLAAAGGGVVLVYRQVTEGLKPDRGDSRDLQHLVMATAAGGVLVTHDNGLRILAESVPGLDVKVLTVPELVEQLDQAH